MSIRRMLLSSVAALFTILGVTAAFAGVVINVAPSGSDDTVNIENAFLSCISTGPNCTVELAAGVFYISRPIVIANFDGTFKGQGKDKTVIQNLHVVPFPLMTTGPEAGFPSMFFFYRDAGAAPNSLRFSDLSIRAIGTGELWSAHDPDAHTDSMAAINVRGAINGIEDFEVSSVDVMVERVSIMGEFGVSSAVPFNLLAGFWVSGELIAERGETILFKYSKPIIGTFTVKNSEFTNMHSPMIVIGLKDSTAVIGGKPNDGNAFNHVAWGVYLADFDNSTVDVSFNNGEDIVNFGVIVENALNAVAGIDLGPVPELLPEPSTYWIHHNTLHLIDIADGIALYDYVGLIGLDATLSAVVTNNKLTLDNSLYGGIVGGSIQNAFVANNKIDGIGLAGIYFGVFGDLNEGWTLLGNNVQNFEGIFPGFSPGVWLGLAASNNTVVGGSNHTNVFDQGTDNTVTGVNNMGGNPPGPEIAEAIANKAELLGSFPR